MPWAEASRYQPCAERAFRIQVKGRRREKLRQMHSVRRYKRRQAQKEEEREKAFERVFNDPDVDLEEVAAQVATYCNLLSLMQINLLIGRIYHRGVIFPESTYSPSWGHPQRTQMPSSWSELHPLCRLLCCEHLQGG